MKKFIVMTQEGMIVSSVTNIEDASDMAEDIDGVIIEVDK